MEDERVPFCILIPRYCFAYKKVKEAVFFSLAASTGTFCVEKYW